MRKFISGIFAVLMLMSIAGCSNNNTPENEIEEPTSMGGVMIANPMESVDSLEELNNALGCNFKKPGVMGVSDESFYIIHGEPELGEYRFSVNGVEYIYRFSSDLANDISGIYISDGTLFGNGETYNESSEFKGARLVSDNGQYTLVAHDNGNMSKETFVMIANELFSFGYSNDISLFSGSYYESIAGRGFIVASVENNIVTFNVEWPNSAAEVCRWTFSGTPSSDGTITYNNAKRVSAVYDENGNGTETVLTETGTGTITLNYDGSLTWVEDDTNPEGSIFNKE